jgi:site-specific recombinase XerD
MICAAVNALEVYLVLTRNRVTDRLRMVMTLHAGQLSLFETDRDHRATEPTVGQVHSRVRQPRAPEPLCEPTVAPRTESADPLALLAGYLAKLGSVVAQTAPAVVDLHQARDDWLRRLRTARRSSSALTAYRIAIDDLLGWSTENQRNVFEEATIVDYLATYQSRADPAPATYYRRFGLLRRFLQWVSRRNGLPDPFVELQPPPKPQQEADWLTEAEFERLLDAAAHPPRRHNGLAERDRLVLLALVQTGLRRAELIALDWGDLDLESERPSLLVRRGKGGKPRRQPLAPPLARELALLRATRKAPAEAPVFCGLEGSRLQPTILASIIHRAATRAELEKRVTAHTLRHTAATWLRQQTGDARLVAAYLGHSDLSTVSRYAHVADDELHQAAAALAALSGSAPAASLRVAEWDVAGENPGARAERFQRDRRRAASPIPRRVPSKTT